MFKRDWLSGAAVGIVATYLFALVPPLIESRPTPPDKLTSQQYDRDAREAMEWGATVKKQGKPDTACGQGEGTPNCSEQYSTALDLSAQWATAQATRSIEWLTKIQTVIGIAGLAGLIVTVALTILTYRTTTRTSQSQLRAYVMVDAAGLEWDNDGNPRAIVSIKNFGQTPALKATYWIGTEFGNDVTFRAPTDEEIAPSRSDIAPNSRRHLDGNYDPMTEAQKARIKARTLPIYAFGQIVYHDVFGEERVTRYRLMLPLGDGVNKENLAFMACEEGNNST